MCGLGLGTAEGEGGGFRMGRSVGRLYTWVREGLSFSAFKPSSDQAI